MLTLTTFQDYNRHNKDHYNGEVRKCPTDTITET